MNRINYFFAVTILFLLFINIEIVHAQLSSSAWPMYNHDTRLSGQSQYNGANTNKFKWKFELPGEAVNASLAIGPDDSVYICNQGVLIALNKNGSLRWKNDLHPGGSGTSTPAISVDGTIYVPFYGTVYAVNSNGTLKWQYKSTSEVADSISVWNNNIFIGSGLDLLCISSSGNLLWKYRIGEEIRTAPAIGSDGTIYVRGRISYLVAISQSGTLKWSLNLGSDISHTYMSPVISPNGIIYTYGLVNKYYPEYGGSYEYTVLYGINQNGTINKVYDEYMLNGAYMTPSVDKNGTIYYAASKFNDYKQQILAIDNNGIVKWNYVLDEGDTINRSSPAIDANGRVYFGSWGNTLYALNSNGQLIWKFNSLNNIDNSPVIGKDGTIYFASWDGYLYAVGEFDPNIEPNVTKNINILPAIELLLEEDK